MIARPLFVTTDAVGGVWNYSVALARGMAANGVQTVLAVLGPAPDAAQRAETSDIPGCTLLNTRLSLEWCLANHSQLDVLIVSLAEQARQVGASAAHLHAPSLAAGPWAIPVVSVAHSCMATWWDSVRGGVAPHNIAWHAEATLRGLSASDAVIAPSLSFANQLGRVYDLSRRIDVIHNGLPAPDHCAEARKMHVLVAGRLWDLAKNIDVLAVAARNMSVPVHAAGPCHAPDGASVSFPDLVTLGNLSSIELHTAMSKTAIFASPACYEPFGLAVLEAAQRATPLVLADIPTFRELWDNAALFVAADDPTAWTSCLNALIQDSARLRRLGEVALHRSRRYTQRAMIKATVAVHERVGHRALRAA